MPKMIEHIALDDIAKIEILLANGRTMAQTKGSADYIMNAGLFEGRTVQEKNKPARYELHPVHHLKVDGKVLATEPWTIWGYAWDTGPDIKMVSLPSKEKANYVGGVELLTPWGGTKDKLIYHKELAGWRQRTAFGLNDTHLMLYCSDVQQSPEGLRDEFVQMGAKTAVMLDGGGSTQGIFKSGAIYSTRPLHNFLGVWLKDSTKTPLGSYVVVPYEGLRYRLGPGTSFERLGLYPQHSTVEIFEITNGWGKTDLGWVSMAYLRPTSVPAEPTPAPDTDAASDYATKAWAKAVSKGLFDGTNPTDPVSREMLSVTFERLGLLD